MRSVVLVDDAVTVGVREVRPADADEGIDVTRADGQDIDLLGGAAARDLDSQRRTALAERKLPADMEEIGDGDRDVARHLEKIALAEADYQVCGGSCWHLQAGGAAPGCRIGSCTGQEIDRRRLGRSVLALVDRDRQATAERDPLDTDQAGAAAAGEGEVALGAADRNRLGKDYRKIVQRKRNADRILRQRVRIVEFAIVVGVSAGTGERADVACADGQN